MKKTIRALMLVPNLRISNGVSTYAMNYFRKLDHSLIQMDFAVFADIDTPYYEEIIQAGGRVYILPSMKKLASHFRYCRRLVRHYDIIHDNSLLVTLPIMVCARRYGISVRILHSHNSKLGETAYKEKRNRLLLPLLYAQATDFAACSKLAGNAMFGRRYFELIPNVIDPGAYIFDTEKRRAVRNAMDAENKFIIITVGRAAYQKNPFFAVDVVSELLEEVPDIEYWWIGSGPLDNDIAEYVKRKNLQNHIKLFGSRTDVKELYQAADCFFLPSLFEGLPLTAVEAQALGLPCVISDTVTDELVYTNLVTFLSLQSDIGVWSDCIFSIIKKPAYRECYNQQLRQSIFSSEGAGRNLSVIYKKMLIAGEMKGKHK